MACHGFVDAVKSPACPHHVSAISYELSLRQYDGNEEDGDGKMGPSSSTAEIGKQFQRVEVDATALTAMVASHDERAQMIGILLREKAELRATATTYKRQLDDLRIENAQLRVQAEMKAFRRHDSELAEENERLRVRLSCLEARVTKASKVARQQLEIEAAQTNTFYFTGISCDVADEGVLTTAERAERERLFAETSVLREELGECRCRAASLAAELVVARCLAAERAQDAEAAEDKARSLEQDVARVVEAKGLSDLLLLNATAETEMVHGRLQRARICGRHSHRSGSGGGGNFVGGCHSDIPTSATRSRRGALGWLRRRRGARSER
eukprot:TRINITY_DN74262_c0_g1_i1.p1 TRINITY_DN74262_c0_g1~~TRINITY_DN74262_c0_g1_i1.p1  ORF type:complete len:327 (+),score=64.53 TRINITY_DN74262_c0_g1_i1:126-1106(+)